MDWEALRAEFPTLDRVTHLNTCSLGALPRAGREAVVRFLDEWQARGASAWYGTWLGEAASLRAKVARLLHCDADEIALAPNVSSALAALATAVPPGGNVACAEMDFPTITHQWLQRDDVDVRLAAPDEARVRTPPEAFEPLVDADTRWLATSHVFYQSGYVQDVPALVRLAHDRGARCVVDGYQAAGQLPVDVRALGVDAYVTGGLKWLLGGPGIAFLYVRRDLHERLAPSTTGWFAHADQFAFETRAFRPAPDARRFEAGTPSVASVYAASAGLDVVLRVGERAAHDRAKTLAEGLRERLLDAKFALACPEEEASRSAILMVRLDDPARVVNRLADEGFLVDHRPGRLRVSPYFYNTEDECARFVDALRRVARLTR